MFSQNTNFTWFAYTHDLADIVIKNTFQGNEMRVFIYLAKNMNKDNFIKIKQIQIAKELEMHKTNVSKIIKTLIKHNLIKKTTNPKEYMINPSYLYVGVRQVQQKKQEYYNNL